MITRRGFFGALAAATMGLAVKLHIPESFIPDTIKTLTYRGVPLVFDQHAPNGVVYFVNMKTLHRVGVTASILE